MMKSKLIALAGVLATGVFANDMNTGGLSGVDNTYSAYSIGQGSVEIGLTGKGSYGNEALHENLPSGAKILHDVLLYGEDASLALGVTNWMDLAVDLPFYQDQVNGFSNDVIGLGDVSASLKIMHPGMKPDALLRLAYIMRASFPTGDFNSGYYARDPQYSHTSRVNTGGAFTSDGFNLNPMLAWTFDLTHLKAPVPLLIHVNFGMDAHISSDANNIPEENTAMQGALALEWQAQRDWSTYLELYGKSRLINVTVGPVLDIFARDRLNLALGTKKTFASGWSAAFAVEGSLSTQENFTKWTTNHSGDGVKNYGIQPTPILGATLTIGFGQVGKNADSDFDGNPNSTDKCPYDAEDYDGYQDEDGCPDPIHLSSAPITIIDTVVVTKSDTVTVVKNDTIRVPVVDSLKYRAQQDPNAIFGFGKTTFPAINFKTGSDSLNRTSFKTLNDIAQSMKNFPQVTIQVIGYTDNTGSEATNKTLSSKRAEAVVNYLVNQGVSSTQLQPLGMGTANPVGSNNTAQGRLLNRRVEFKRVK